MKIFYPIVYNSSINRIFRNFLKAWNGKIPFNYELPVTGKIVISIPGNKMILVTNQTSFISKVLFYRGWDSFEYSPIFYRLISEINCFLDIGANIGYYSVFAGLTNPHCKVVAFEPAPGPLHYLRKNISENHLDNIEIENIALSNFNGNSDFQVDQTNKYKDVEFNLSGEHNLGQKNSDRFFKTIEVETKTLDEYTNARKLSEVDLIKIDTEGNEHLILEKGVNCIKTFRPVVICETLFNTNEIEIEAFFEQFNYTYYRWLGTDIEKVESIQRTSDDGVRNCFFVPKEKADWFEKSIMAKI